MARNIITEERYNKIKPHVGNPKDDSKNKKKYGIGQSVIRDIRNTADYTEYKKRGATYRKFKREVDLALDKYGRQAAKVAIDEYGKRHTVTLPGDPRPASELFSGKNLYPRRDVNKKGKIVDILVVAAIVALLIVVLIFGGK